MRPMQRKVNACSFARGTARTLSRTAFASSERRVPLRSDLEPAFAVGASACDRPYTAQRCPPTNQPTAPPDHPPAPSGGMSHYLINLETRRGKKATQPGFVESADQAYRPMQAARKPLNPSEPPKVIQHKMESATARSGFVPTGNRSTKARSMKCTLPSDAAS